MSVCIVIPVYKERNQLTAYEEISLKQCFKVLCNHPIFFVGPGQLNWDEYRSFSEGYNCKTDVKIFSGKYFSDLGGYSRLLLNVRFYKAFSRFDYLLIYQTDAFVFCDKLDHWCKKQFDYIGAPWFEGFSSTNLQAPFAGVGNGGFSLRKIRTHLKVLHSFSYINPPPQNWRKRMEQRRAGKHLVYEAAGFMLDLFFRNNTYWLLNSFMGFEDQFWGLVAPRNFKWFKMASVKEAMQFSIEMQPGRVYELNGRQLPFGCHAWWKYDFEFWKPHVEKQGYQLKDSR